VKLNILRKTKEKGEMLAKMHKIVLPTLFVTLVSFVRISFRVTFCTEWSHGEAILF